MPVRHVIRTEPVHDDVNMIYENADEEFRFATPSEIGSDSDSDSDYSPSDGYDSSDDEPLPPRRSARKTRKSGSDRTENGLVVENTNGNPDEEMEFDVAERASPPIIPSTLPQKLKDVLNLIAVQHGTLAGGEIQHVALDYIQNSMDPMVLQLVAKVLELAPDNILAQVANCVAQVVYNCWINKTEPFMLGEVIAMLEKHDGNRIVPFLDQLRHRDVEAAFTRADWSGPKLAHLIDGHMRITGTEGLEIGSITASYCPDCGDFDHQPAHIRTLAEVKDFIETLPIVPLKDFDEGEVCGICRETWADLAATELPLQLPCTHVFSDQCLVNLLGPKAEGFWEHDLCPVCRQKIPLLEQMD